MPKHLLNRDGRVVCGASPRDPDFALTNIKRNATCDECRHPHTCEHPRDRSEEEKATLRIGRLNKTPKPSFCGDPASVVEMPDGSSGAFCERHAAQVTARVQRRMALQQ